MKNNYTKQQIEEILNVLTNPEEFQEFTRKMYELCNHKEELPEDGSFFTPITDDVTLIVPTESIEAYSSHDFWGKFDIEGFSDDPVV